MNRRLSILAGATLVAAPLADRAASALGASGQTVYGPSVRMQYGPVQVGIKVRGGRMTLVFGHAPTDHPRSRQINNRAMPILEREALRAQSVRGVHTVSGASLTSFAFQSSLARAMAKAHLPGA